MNTVIALPCGRWSSDVACCVSAWWRAALQTKGRSFHGPYLSLPARRLKPTAMARLEVSNLLFMCLMISLTYFSTRVEFCLTERAIYPKWSLFVSLTQTKGRYFLDRSVACGKTAFIISTSHSDEKKHFILNQRLDFRYRRKRSAMFKHDNTGKCWNVIRKQVRLRRL